MNHRNALRKCGPFVFCLVVGLGLVYYPDEWRLHSTIHALRDALMVAGIIGLCIELFSATLLIQETADELSEKLVGYGLPSDAQIVISSIVRSTLVYRNYEKTYHLTLVDNEMSVRVVVTYNVVNNGPETYRGYHPKLQEEGMHKPVLNSLSYGKHAAASKSVDTEIDPSTRVVSFFPNTKPVSIFKSRATDTIESLTTDQCCRVRWHYTLRMPLDYSDVTSFGGITIHPSIVLADVPAGYDFNADDSPDGENKCEHADGGRQWVYRRAFVRAQHIRAWWRPHKH
jgi:hypothetical protein